GQARVPQLRRHERVPRVRPGHEPGVGRVGRYLRGGAPQAAQGLGRPPAPRVVALTFAGDRTAPRGRPFASGLGEGDVELDQGAAAVAGEHLDGAAELRLHHLPHDRETEAVRLVDGEVNEAANTVVDHS